MKEFIFYFIWGWDHILAESALDHILFIASLAMIFRLREWKSILVLITAFTIGHLLTLWLSVTGLIHISTNWVETMIPITIAITALSNMFDLKTRLSLRLHYVMALFFGLVHGMGYANAISFAISDPARMGRALFAFNVGLEVGQVIVVSIVVAFGEVITRVPGVNRSWWVWVGSFIILFLSFYMLYQRAAF